MADIKKVKHGIKNCIADHDCYQDCPYFDDCHDLKKPMFADLAKDALSVIEELQEEIKRLKGHEAVEQKPGEWIYGEDETGADGWRCSECGFFEPWFYEFTDDIDFIKFYGFCPGCGRKMAKYTGKSAQECR